MIIQLSGHAELNPDINNHDPKKEDDDPVVQITSGSALTHSVSKCLSGVCTGLVKPRFSFKSVKVAGILCLCCDLLTDDCELSLSADVNHQTTEAANDSDRSSRRSMRVNGVKTPLKTHLSCECNPVQLQLICVCRILIPGLNRL